MAKRLASPEEYARRAIARYSNPSRAIQNQLDRTEHPARAAYLGRVLDALDAMRASAVKP